MRTIEETFRDAEYLQPKVYIRYKLGSKENLKEDFIKAFEYYDRTIDTYKHLSAYDEIIDWMVDTKGKGLIIMGECGLGKSTILNYVIPAIFRTKTNKVLRSIPAKELGTVERNIAPFIITTLHFLNLSKVLSSYLSLSELGDKLVVIINVLELSSA